jgi:2-keto-4-pentenoate hydratase/2-oxohepta-3-ene-1,7-dioic acid hydratase in catechol pathway
VDAVRARQEHQAEVPEYPLIFSNRQPASSDREMHSAASTSKQVEHEAELAVVIGNVTRLNLANAAQAILVTHNDILPGLQRKDDNGRG